jgi:hypothetical protein
MKMTAQQYHKQKQAAHEWKVCYNDALTGKEHSFTCSTYMKRSHELLLSSNSFVKNVIFSKNLGV